MKMASGGRFLNAILCEDVRYEVLNKKTIVGTLSGNIIVPELPAAIEIAVFMEYVSDDENHADTLEFQLWMDDKSVRSAQIRTKPHKDSSTMVLPRTVFLFEKEGVLRLTGTINGGAPIEIIRKTVRLGEVPPKV